MDRVGQLGLGQAFLGRGRGDGDTTAAKTARRSVIGGSRGAPGAVASEIRATASAAAAIIGSLIRLALATVTPNPRPGNIRALFAWAIW